MPQNIIITGASGGIGSAAARAFAAEGARVFLAGNRNTEALSSLTEELKRAGTDAAFAASDLSTAEGCREIFEKSMDFFGQHGPDILINNAGISRVRLIQDGDEAGLQEVLQTNLASCIRMCREVSRVMIARHAGRILNVSSVFGISGASCEAEYSAAKGAMNAFTKSLAKELAPSGISVNAIAPGAVDTVMNSRLSEEERKALCEEIPAGRFASPEEIAECLVLLSKAPLYLTGQIIAVDGGWY